MKIAFCQATYSRDFEETKLCIERVSPYVDHTIITYDQSLRDDQIKWLTDNSGRFNIIPVKHEFRDNLPEMRNSYVRKAKELDIDWICVSDPDELYSEELAKNLKNLIVKYNNEGYNVLAVPVKDQFDCVEWLDNLDMLKECPGGYRETDYWKPLLIYKLLHDIRYDGIGRERNVHETLISAITFRTINLPKQYHYVHKKSALKIWRNGARNMYIGGGGDNVGIINPLWSKLKDICVNRLNISCWQKFEEFVQIGVDTWTQNDQYKSEFNQWLIDALQSPTNAWGTETRELAKWYFALHKDNVDEYIESLIKNTPKITREIAIENFVVKTYFDVLGRHPDDIGKNYYVGSILKGKIRKDELSDIFKNCQEYKQKFGETKMMESVEEFVDRIYHEILNRSPDVQGQNHYIKEIYEGRIKRNELESIFKNSDEYKLKFGITSESTEDFVNRMYREILKRVPDESGKNHYIKEIDEGRILKYELEDIFKNSEEYRQRFLKNINISKSDSIALCIMGYRSGIEMIKESINTIGKMIDQIHIQADDLNEDDITDLKSLEKNVDKPINIHIEKWQDNFSDYKNKCASRASTEWVIILDHDEIPTIELASNIKDIIRKSNRFTNYNMVSFDVIDVRKINGNIISENKSSSGKPLLHKNISNPYYGNPHIWLKNSYYPWKVIHSNFAYKHVKEVNEELPRSVRNIFMGGGGDSVKEKNPNWVELRRLCDNLGIKDYKSFDEYIKKGKIDSNILDILKKLAEMQWKDNELKDPIRYYYLLHPDEEI
jgi:hypothetical protein